MFAFRKKPKPSKDEQVAPAVALITEDEPLLLLNATEMLQDMGFTVLGAKTVDEAVAVLQDNSVELLITDIHMPGNANGLELARIVAERWPEVKIVVCSGRERVVQSQMPTGATFVPKPYTMEDIENAILSF